MNSASSSKPAFLKYLGTLTTLAGLATIIWSAALVVAENRLLKMPLDHDMEDIPALRELASRPRSGCCTRPASPR